MKVICISARAQAGKDYVANIIKEKLEDKGERVKIMHYADLLKHILSTFFSWQGEKNEEGRRLLQVVGTDTIRHKCPDYWVNFIIDILKFFPNEYDFILLPDTRFPNEIDRMKEQFDTISVRIERPNGWENNLTEEQKQHESEIALDNYNFDYRLFNNGDESIYDVVNEFLCWISERSDEDESKD